MKQFFTIIITFIFINNIFAQCQENRYETEVFENIVVNTVTYSDSSGFEMDIYQAEGDTVNNRPVLIFAHGGGYFAGVKTNPTMVSLCSSFAKRGYVTASIQYSLSTLVELTDSISLLSTVVSSVADGKAAIRYFRKDFAAGNNYGIDPEQIWVGGNSAGAILMSHLAFLDEGDNLPAYILDEINGQGGFEGNKGNYGFSSEVRGVINLAGGLNKPEWILNETDIALVSCHGDMDGTVPFDCNDVFWTGPFAGFDLVDICGSGIIHPIADDIYLDNELLVFEGDDHTPWEVDATKRTTMTNFVSDFIYNRLDCNNNYTNNENYFNADVAIYPNPTSNILNIITNEFNAVNIRTLDGKIVYNNLINNNLQVNLQSFENGVYLLELQNDENIFIKKIVKN